MRLMDGERRKRMRMRRRERDGERRKMSEET